jgi:DegV family protein with EDD domain
VDLTRDNTAVVLDSTSDFFDARERHPNMRIVPLYVLFDGEPLRDHVDIGPAAFYERLAASKTLPTTSQPTPADFLACYEELRAAGFARIWSLHLTSKLSGTYESAVRAAEQLGFFVVGVVATETASLACALLAEAIDRRLERGTTDEEIAELVERFKQTNRVVFTVDTLEYLQKGGRIGKAQALAGSLLHVKPILSVRDGVIEPVGRVRGRQKAVEEFAKLFEAGTEDRGGLRLAIAHANAPEWVDVLTDMAHRIRPRASVELVETLGAVVGTHAGPGAVGFFWFQD